MNLELVKWLRCPHCKRGEFDVRAFQSNQRGIEDGIIVCLPCSTWYPIIESIPVISVNPLLVHEAKKEIKKKWDPIFDFTKLSPDPIPPPSESHRLQQRQIKHYTHEADHYDQEIANTVFWKSVAWNTVRAWAEAVAKRFEPILEVGCGTGSTTVQLLEAGHRVVAMDICFAAVKKAFDKVRSLPVSSKADFVVSEAENLPFPDRSFEVAVFTGVLHHVSRPDQVVKEIGRLLAKDGILYGYENNATIFRFLFDLLMHIHRLWHEEAGSEPLIQSEEAKQWGSDGGFELQTKSTVFLPPHLFNLFPLSIAKKLLCASDRFFQSVPGIREHGGLIVISGRKIR